MIPTRFDPASRIDFFVLLIPIMPPPNESFVYACQLEGETTDSLSRYSLSI